MTYNEQEAFRLTLQRYVPLSDLLEKIMSYDESKLDIIKIIRSHFLAEIVLICKEAINQPYINQYRIGSIRHEIL